MILNGCFYENAFHKIIVSPAPQKYILTRLNTVKLFIFTDVPRWNNDYVKKAAAYLGEKAEIKCVVLSLPTAEFYWLRNGINITSSTDYIITAEGNTSTLHINSVKDTEYGYFDCSANNYVGGRNFSIEFTSPGKI